MRKLAIVITLLPMLAACSSFGWQGQGGNLTKEQKDRGIKDVEQLSSTHDTQSFWRDLRRRSDGRSNAFWRDLMDIQEFVDRHFWNYSADDPYVNYPSDTTMLQHFGRFGLSTMTTVPGVDSVTKR